MAQHGTPADGMPLDLSASATQELRVNGVRVLTQSNRRLDQHDPGSLLLAEIAAVEAKAEEIEALLKQLENQPDGAR